MTGKPTSLTANQQEAIREMAEGSNYRISVKVVAKALGLPWSTVSWFMYRDGLKRRTDNKIAATYVRNGLEVHPFTEDQDEFIQEMRVAGHSISEIANLATEKFGFVRKPHSVKVRLILLAGFESAEEAA